MYIIQRTLNFPLIFLERNSPRHFFNAQDEELMNAKPSQQFYDNMISQINNQIARASDDGVTHQNSSQYTTGGAYRSGNIDEENEWC